MFHNYETEKITHKASDLAENLHDDLWWKNRTTWYNCRFSAASLALWV